MIRNYFDGINCAKKKNVASLSTKITEMMKLFTKKITQISNFIEVFEKFDHIAII